MHGSVILDGLDLNGPSRFGQSIVHSIDGWRNRPGIKTQAVARPTGHGDFKSRVYNDSRNVTINGTLLPSSPEQLQEFSDYLNSLLAGPSVEQGLSGGRLHVEWFGSTRWADVAWDSSAKVDFLGPPEGMYAVFQIPLKCDDPQKYGAEHVFSVLSSVPTFHHGNYPADGKLIVTGSWPGGYRLNSGSGLVSVIAPVVPGKTHVLDFRRRTLRIDGLLVPKVITTGDFWETAPGLDGRRNVLITPITTKSVDATANYYLTDTYI